MSFLKENKKQSVNFSGIPLYVKDQILQKMNFKTYATYMMTGREAGELSARNDKYIYSMPIYRMTIKGEKVSFMDGLQIKLIPFEKCAKMKLRPQVIAVLDLSLSIKTCDFLLELEEIPTFECTFLDGGVPHIAEFFKKTKIQTMKMSLVQFVGEDFDYDTSHIEKVEVYNKRVFTPYNILEIKARRSLVLNRVQIKISQLYTYLLALLNGSDMPDLIMNDCIFCNDDWAELMNVLEHRAIKKENSAFVLKLGDKLYVNVDIQSFNNPHNLKFLIHRRL